MDLSFYKSSISEEIRDEGRTQGRIEDILVVLETRGIDIPGEIRERITACEDPGLLRRWLTRAVVVTVAEEIFTEEDA